MKKALYFLSLAFTFLIILGGIIAFLFFREDIQKRFFSKQETNQPGALAPNEPLVTCKAGDSACESKNERIKANKLQGQSAGFARHQCDGPRACPTPNPEQEQTAEQAIKAFAKDPKLELIRMSGINAAGLLYFCDNDNTCWNYNTKTKKISSSTPPEEKN